MPTHGPLPTGLVLLGAGAAHLEVLRRFARCPPPGVRLTLVVAEPDTPYPGRLPALIRGEFAAADAHIDLATLAVAAGARLILAEATGLDLTARTLELAGRPAMPFDLLSVDLAGESAMPDPSGGGIPVSPPARFLAQLPALEAAVPDGARLAVIGDDSVAIELVLALAQRFRGRLHLVLVTEAQEPLATAPPRARRMVRAALVDAGVELASAVRAGPLTDARLALSDGSFLPADVALWARDRLAPAFLAESGLACDAARRVLVNAGQRSISHPWIFAAGDCAAPPHDRPAGALLAANLGRAARGRSLARVLPQWRPPRIAPTVLYLGAGRAVAWSKELSVSGEAVGRAKVWRDRANMRRYAAPVAPVGFAFRRLPAHRPQGAPALALLATSAPPAMMPLIPSAPDALVGAGKPDHAAVLTPPAGQALVQSVSALRACIEDPFVFGQIAAAHALSDLYAMGARPWIAQAIAAAPPDAAMHADWHAMLAGVSDTLFTDGCTLVGACRTAASEASLGLVLSGLGDPARLLRKSGARPGDMLLLTKPLGTGIVLAAHERGVARGRWLAAAIGAMRTSNAAAARVLRERGATACAAVGEGGLLRRLEATLSAAHVGAVLWLDAVPALPGALELAAAGVTAGAKPYNASARPQAGADPRAALLADPQISGGLIAVLPPTRADACLMALHDAGVPATIVGEVEAAIQGQPQIRLEAGQGSEAGNRHVPDLLVSAD